MNENDIMIFQGIELILKYISFLHLEDPCEKCYCKEYQNCPSGWCGDNGYFIKY